MQHAAIRIRAWVRCQPAMVNCFISGFLIIDVSMLAKNEHITKTMESGPG